jgi:hypothetical protein
MQTSLWGEAGHFDWQHPTCFSGELNAFDILLFQRLKADHFYWQYPTFFSGELHAFDILLFQCLKSVLTCTDALIQTTNKGMWSSEAISATIKAVKEDGRKI